MPIYEYACLDCRLEFEELVRGDQQPVCPQCGRSRLERHLSGRRLLARPTPQGHVRPAIPATWAIAADPAVRTGPDGAARLGRPTPARNANEERMLRIACSRFGLAWNPAACRISSRSC